MPGDMPPRPNATHRTGGRASPVAGFLQHLRRDRRGSVSLFFAGSATVLLGCVALATEAGSWYVSRRNAQNAADAAAGAAVLALAGGGNAAAGRLAAEELARRNGFQAATGTTVTVNIPPSAGPFAGDATAAEVVIRQTQSLLLAGLFTDTPPAVQVRAVARAFGTSDVCALALRGSISMGGNSFTSGEGCVLASNNRGTGSISVTGSAEIIADSLSASGTCVGCNSPTAVRLTRPYAEYQPPARNPYAALDDIVQPSFSGCVQVPASGVLTPFDPAKPSAYCGISLSGNKTLTFTPGHYYIRNGGFDIQSGTVLCSGCTGGKGVTIVFTGDPAQIGGPSINANASVTLVAPAANPVDPRYNGVLFHRDDRAPVGSLVTINGGAATTLAGGMYFPTSLVRFNGNAEVRNSSCIALVADTLDFTGTADVYLDVSGCPAYATPVPRTITVRLSE
jgi:Flp pilus assembly protein TadG